MHILIPRDPYHDKFFVRRTGLDMNEAIDLLEKFGYQVCLCEVNTNQSHVDFSVSYLRDDIRESITGDYYISKTIVVEDHGLSSKYRIDFANDDDATIFKLSWL